MQHLRLLKLRHAEVNAVGCHDVLQDQHPELLLPLFQTHWQPDYDQSLMPVLARMHQQAFPLASLLVPNAVAGWNLVDQDEGRSHREWIAQHECSEAPAPYTDHQACHVNTGNEQAAIFRRRSIAIHDKIA